jgi:hypothetical protein
MAYQNKAIYEELLRISITLDLIPAEKNIDELKEYIKKEDYEKALYKMVLYLLRALNETNIIENTAKVIYIDKLIDLLDQFYKEPKNTEILTKDYINILIRYIRHLKSDAFIKGNKELWEVLNDKVEDLEILL